MIHACFDTSTNNASFVLFDGNKEVLNISKECVKGASKLLPLIRKEVKNAEYELSQVSHWSVGKGPGSFTGMRVGISFVKGICFASNAQFRGINSGYGYIFNLSDKSKEGDKITVLHDGRRQEVISNTFLLTGNNWEEQGTEVIKICDLDSRLSDLGMTITNMPVDLFPENIQDKISYKDSINSAFYAKVPFEDGLSLEEMDASCEPIYVRPPVFIQPKSK